MLFRIRQLLFFIAAAAVGPVGNAAQSVAQAEVAGGATANIKEAGKLTAAQDPLATSSLWQLTLGMLLVLGLIMGIAWVLKRTGRFQQVEVRVEQKAAEETGPKTADEDTRRPKDSEAQGGPRDEKGPDGGPDDQDNIELESQPGSRALGG